MEFNYHNYQKEECKIGIGKLPIWFKEVKYEGDEKEGSLVFHSQNDYDEFWGGNAKMDLYWETRERGSFFFSKLVEQSIETYNAIGLVVTSKENTWHLSHEFIYWYGQRTKMLHKHHYSAKSIHGIFYCDMTERLFNIHTEVINKFYENFKPYILKGYSTITCHNI
jgi:hypothetical protein